MGEEGVQEGVWAWVDGVKKNQQELGVWDSDERELEGGGDSEEGDRRHADKVGEDEHSHALSHSGVGMRRRWRGFAVGQVDAEVTTANAEEGQDVKDQ